MITLIHDPKTDKYYISNGIKGGKIELTMTDLDKLWRQINAIVRGEKID
jgi:hypothetical protein